MAKEKTQPSSVILQPGGATPIKQRTAIDIQSELFLIIERQSALAQQQKQFDDHRNKLYAELQAIRAKEVK